MTLHKMNSAGQYISLKKRDDQIVFYESDNGSIDMLGEIKIDWNLVMARFIRNPIPGESEIEAAINYIEDELMKDLRLVNKNGLDLYTDNAELSRLLRNGSDQSEFTKNDIEKEFTRYAHLSMGGSSVVSGVEMDVERYMALLVVREILNHLNFDSLKISSF